MTGISKSIVQPQVRYEHVLLKCCTWSVNPLGERARGGGGGGMACANLAAQLLSEQVGDPRK